MRITRISHLFYPDIISDYLAEFSMRQVKMGHEVDVLTWNKNKRYPEESIADGFTIRRLAGFNFSVDGIVTDYPYLPNLPNRIAQLKPEIIHAESHLFLTTAQAIKKAKKLSIPSVATVHGVMAERNAFVNLAQYVYLYTVGSWIFKNVDRIICLTESDAREIISYRCPSEKIRIIPNAVDTSRFKPAMECQENLVVWVGRFVPEKGLDYLIEAAKIVAREFKDVEFMLVGYGPLRGNFRKLAYHFGLLNNVIRFAGPLGRDQVANILGKASVFVLPSLKEGLPLSLLEAMACGKPVIGSDVSGINDVIIHGENGILVPPRKPETLAHWILTLLNDENLRKRLGQTARQRIVEKYSWNMVLNKLENIYWEILNETRK